MCEKRHCLADGRKSGRGLCAPRFGTGGQLTALERLACAADGHNDRRLAHGRLECRVTAAVDVHEGTGLDNGVARPACRLVAYVGVVARRAESARGRVGQRGRDRPSRAAAVARAVKHLLRAQRVRRRGRARADGAPCLDGRGRGEGVAARTSNRKEGVRRAHACNQGALAEALTMLRSLTAS